MENNTKLNERLLQYMQFKELNAARLAESVGASNSYFNKVLKNNTSIGSDRIEKILRTYPDLNAEWFLTGEGQMLKSPEQYSNSEQEIKKLKAEVIELQGKLIDCLENRLLAGSPSPQENQKKAN